MVDNILNKIFKGYKFIIFIEFMFVDYFICDI